MRKSMFERLPVESATRFLRRARRVRTPIGINSRAPAIIVVGSGTIVGPEDESGFLVVSGAFWCLLVYWDSLDPEKANLGLDLHPSFFLAGHATNPTWHIGLWQTCDRAMD